MKIQNFIYFETSNLTKPVEIPISFMAVLAIGFCFLLLHRRNISSIHKYDYLINTTTESVVKKNYTETNTTNIE